MLVMLVAAGPVFAKENFKLRPGAENKLCLKCHETFQKTLKSRAVHQPLKTGKCSDCHDPHTSVHKKLLASGTNTLCTGCHKEVLPDKPRSAHQIVVAGDCVKCHAAHASDNKFILKKPGNELCSDCHQDVGTKAKEARFKHSPLMKDKGCLNCHAPHASDRSDYLLKNVVPALCKQCHLAAGSPNATRTKKQGTELCKECHRDTIKEISAKSRMHWPLSDKVGCLNCHSPHGSKQKKLLAGSVRDTCGKCHADTVELQQWSIKNPKNQGLCEPVRTGNCVTCHAPHAADNVLLIRQKDISTGLCGECHQWETHSTHPIGKKVVDPRDKNLTVECLSCHKACGTGNKPNMMPFETTYDLCIQCHPERRK